MKTPSNYVMWFAAACILALSGGAGTARAGDAWLDANGIRIDNVNLNGQHATNNTYWIDPPFLSAKVRPNVLFVLDNSGSMNEPAYRSAYDPTQFVNGAYFGYFEPNTMYRYASNEWSPTTLDTAAATPTNPIAKGDFLNWAYMAKIEAAKKLLLGGKANPRSMGTGCCVKLTGETSADDAAKYYDNSMNSPTDMKIYPFAGNYEYYRSGNSLSVSNISTANTVYLYPLGNLVSNGTWTPAGAPTAWQAVDEEPNDGDTTMITNKSTSDMILFDYDYPGASIGTITNVTVQAVAKKSSSTQMNLQAVLQFTYGGSTTWHTGATVALSTSYATYNLKTWTTNPATGLNWDWGDIKSVGAGAMDGFGIIAVGSGTNTPTAANYPTVTEVRLIITTTTPDGGPYRFVVDTGRSDVRGIMDELSNDARFGLALYNSGQRFEVGGGGTQDAGHIDTYVDFGTPTNMITTIGNLSPSTWTPLAETVYQMIGYFRQDAPYYSSSPSDYIVGQNYDPYYFKYSNLAGSGLADQYVPCAKSFILMLTDGEPTQDRNIPAWLQDYDGDGRDAPLCTNCNSFSDYIDDVAYYARQNDHRADLTGTQNILIYPVFMFGKGSSLLMETAINGGYDDLDGNHTPGCKFPATAGAPTQDELRECYRDSNNNQTIDPFNAATNPTGDLPLTFYQGDDGYELQVSIVDAIAAILKRAASGTSVSVLGSSWKGEGSMYQAYFYPEKVEGMRRIKWTGYFHSLFVDRHGLIHEDTNGDGIMRPDDDYVVEFEFQAGQDTKIKYFYDRVNNADPSDNHPDGLVDSSIPVRILSITDVNPLWDGGKMLARRNPADRSIYTAVDDLSVAVPMTYQSLIPFNTTVAADVTKLRPYLRAKTDAAAANVINFIRGAEISGWRDRRLTVDGSLVTWKLGDIVYSDPVVVAAPKERFDVIYNDRTYAEFYNKWAKRRSIVYVGGNDGMLHAFNSGYYISTTESNPTSDKAQITFCTSLDPLDTTRCGPLDADKPLGKELWGFIPPDVLPHLAWMADPDYLHTYYVDNMVRVTDARIFAADADHPNGWGTILLVSLRFGGGEIDVTDTFDGIPITKQFKSAYYALDVTNPDIPPKLIWRFTDKEMGFTLSTPTIVREEASGQDHWYAVMGSGPTNYRGGRAVDNTTTNTKFTRSTLVPALPAALKMDTTYPHLYIINLATGSADSAWTPGPGGRKGVIQSAISNRFLTTVTAVDYPLDYKYDMIYYAHVGCNSGCSADGYGTWGGRVSRIKTYNLVDPGQWVMSDAFYTAQPITAKPAVGLDQRGNIWVYVGTGRFLHVDDRFDTTAQHYYGFKDTCYYSGCTSVITNGSNILNSSAFTVNVDGTITPSLLAGALGAGKPSATISRFDDLATFMRDQGDGWKIGLGASERVIVNGFVVGGIAGFGSYTPTQSVCEFEGRSRQYYPYYLTGTVPYIPGGTFMYSVYVDSGGGLPSIPAVHIDSAGNVKLFLQKSTGEIKVLEMKQAQTVTGGLGAGGECN